MTTPRRVPSERQLLRELDRRSHSQRLSGVAQLARDAAGDPRLAALVEKLAAGDIYQRTLAVAMARASANQPAVRRAVADASLSVRSAALNAASVLDSDAVYELVLAAAPADRRKLLRGAVRRSGAALAERLVEPLRAAYGPEDAARLLSACTDETVGRLLPEVEHAIGSWRGLARQHPDVVMRFIRGRFDGAQPYERERLWRHYSAPLGLLARVRPLEVLDLAESFGDDAVLPEPVALNVRLLARRAPARIVALVLRPGYAPTLLRHGVPAGLLAEFRALAREDQVDLAKALAEAPHHLARLLAAVAPSERADLFRATYEGVDTSQREWPAQLLDALPHATRDAEARRMLALRRVRESDRLTRVYTAFADIDFASPVLTAATRLPDAEERAEAYQLLLACIGRYRRGLDQGLETLRRLRNEQDPVRLAAVQQLAALPPSLFHESHVPALTAVVEAVTGARDTSAQTLHYLERLALALLRISAPTPGNGLFTWALTALQQLARLTGALTLPSLEADLPRGSEQAIVDALLGRLAAGAAVERHDLALALGRALGRRAAGQEALQRLIGEAVNSPVERTARQAAELWLTPARTRDARVVNLLRRDPSAIVLPRVFPHVHLRRQDLLDPYLRGRPIEGRFLSGRTPYLLPAAYGFHRWLPRQQEAYARLLRRIVDDDRQTVDVRTRAAATLVYLPALPVGSALDLLDLPEEPIAEAALGALPWSDNPADALPVLLRYVDTDRARVAMYAVRRCALFVAPDALAAILDGLLSQANLRVTVHKEAVRLLGDFPTQRSAELLEREWARELPRDVRIAAGHAALRLLIAPTAWQILDDLANADDEAVARTLLDANPRTLTPAWRSRYAKIVLGLTRHPARGVRLRAFTELPRWASEIEEQIATIASATVLDSNATGEWGQAQAALIELAEHPAAGGALVELTRALLDAAADEPFDASPQRDRPYRQRLHTLLHLLTRSTHNSTAAQRAIRRAVAEVTSTDATLWPQTAAVKLAVLRWEDPAAALAELGTLADGLHARPADIGALLSSIRSNLYTTAGSWQRPELLQIADVLADRGDAAGGLLALKILEVTEHSQWDEHSRALLRRLRSHPDISTRTAALGVFSSPE